MLTTALALIAATLTAEAAPTYTGGSDPLTASAKVGSDVFCIRSGWNMASFQTNRRVRRGECLTAADWRKRGLEFETPTIAIAKARRSTDAQRMAAR